MKRVYGLMLAMLFLALPLPAMAEGESPTPSPTQTTAQPTALATQAPTASATAATGLSIDSLNIYDGMDQAYMNGYTPRVKSGKATVVLPLVANGAIQGSAVTATLSLGDPSSAPFVFKNYQKTVELTSNKVASGGTVASYLVRFDLPLKKGRIDGAYPVTITISAVASDGTVIQKSYTWYVIITDGKDPNATEPAATATPPESQPKLIVSSYSLNPSPAVAGKPLIVTVKLRNTSENQAVQNIKITASCDSSDFALKNDSNTIFLDKIAAGGTADVTLNYDIALKALAQQETITLAMEYDNAQAVTLSATGTVAIAVAQPLRVELETPPIASAVNAGDTLPLTFQVMNLGRGTVYNVRCTVEAPGLFPSGAAFIGNMEAGTAKTADLDVFIGTKDMTKGHEKDDKYGPTSGTITLIYEDESGKEYTEKTEISTTINVPVISTTSTMPTEEPKKAGQWWVSIIIGALIVAALAAVLVYRGRRGRKHENH
jgi:hypothetical protein